MNLSNYIKLFIVVVSGLGILTTSLFAFLLWPLQPVTVPDEVFTVLVQDWKDYMVQGVGSHNSASTDTYRHTAFEAVSGESGITIDSPYHNGSYLRSRGGPIDIVHGENVEYVLYGNEMLQSHVSNKLSFNDGFIFLHANFYLVRRDPLTKLGTILKQWERVPNSYGLLSYEPESKILTVTLCSIATETIVVTEDLFKKTLAESVITCVPNHQR